MSKTLYVSCVSLACGGAERVLSILTSRFADRYDTVKVFMWIDLPVFYEMDDRLEIISIEKECGSKNYLKKIGWFRNYVRHGHPDLILSFLAKSSINVLLATTGLHIPVIVGERNDPRFLKGGKPMIVIRDLIYNRATRILEQTENNKNYFSGAKYRKTDVIYNPVFMDLNVVGSALSAEKQRVMVSVGRLNSQKNHELLINSFKIFCTNHPEYKLIIYGEGENRANLEHLIERNQLTGKVLLPGSISNVFDQIKGAELFVMSSIFEGMPNALLEAMCLGLPCISTKVSGAVDLIKNGQNGLLVDIGDKDALVNAMETLASDQKMRESLGAEALKLYDLLNVDTIASQWCNYLDRYML